MKPKNTKYAVALSRMANSFYDPDCRCNLFKSTPVYHFNHPPTMTIKEAVKHGRLIDLVGNILDENAEKQAIAEANERARIMAAAEKQNEEDLAEKEAKAIAAAKAKAAVKEESDVKEESSDKQEENADESTDENQAEEGNENEEKTTATKGKKK